MSPNSPRTLFDKVWESRVVTPETADAPGLLYVDLHLIHEVTSPQAFSEIEARGLKVRRPDRTFGTLDHSTPTLPPDASGHRPYVTKEAESQVATLERNCAKHGVVLAGWDSDDRGIVHVMAPELGLTQPGQVVVCGDSHTATHGAFGAIAFGIGTSQVRDVLASQCLALEPLKVRRIDVDGRLSPGVYAKDVILTIIRRLGVQGGNGFAGIFERIAGAAAKADFGDDGERHVFRGHARLQLAIDGDAHAFGLALQQALRGEHVADF